MHHFSCDASFLFSSYLLFIFFLLGIFLMSHLLANALVDLQASLNAGLYKSNH